MQGNRIDGELKISLDISDLDIDKPAMELVAGVYGHSLGEDDEPSVTLFTRSPGEDDGCESLWIISVRKLRALCDMAESQHRLGVLQLEDGGDE